MKKITEKQLLDGYDGLTNGLDLISIVEGHQIIWCYRDDGPEDCCPVIDHPASASYPIITLEYDRCARIATDANNLDHPNLAKLQEAINKIAGAMID